MTDPGPDEDVSHPIPRLDAYDVILKTDSGARIGIVIATPLRDMPRDRARFERKMQVALAYFQSDEFRHRWGTPNPKHCGIYSDIHAASDRNVIDLVFAQTDRIRDAGLDVAIKLLKAN